MNTAVKTAANQVKQNKTKQNKYIKAKQTNEQKKKKQTYTHLPHSDPAFKTYSDKGSIASAVNIYGRLSYKLVKVLANGCFFGSLAKLHRSCISR